MAAELSFRTYFAGHTGNFSRERVELIHHDVDRVFQLEDFAARVNCDLLREVSIRNRGGNQRNVSHLVGEIAGEKVYVVGEVLPGSGNTLNFCLAAELSFRPPFPAHTRNFSRERAELVHHRIDRVFQL